DVAPYVERKLKALEAHASQGENIFLLRMPADAPAGTAGARRRAAQLELPGRAAVPPSWSCRMSSPAGAAPRDLCSR
ncbi:hypothetical protein AB0B56_24015, partial [Streptosporangium canum]